MTKDSFLLKVIQRTRSSWKSIIRGVDKSCCGRLVSAEFAAILFVFSDATQGRSKCFDSSFRFKSVSISLELVLFWMLVVVDRVCQASVANSLYIFQPLRLGFEVFLLVLRVPPKVLGAPLFSVCLCFISCGQIYTVESKQFCFSLGS